MDPKITSEYIDRYNNGELSDEELSKFAIEMQVNPLLREEVFIDKQLNEFLKDRELIDLRWKLRKISARPFHRLRRFAMALTWIGVFLLVGTALLYLFIVLDSCNHEIAGGNSAKPSTGHTKASSPRVSSPLDEIKPVAKDEGCIIFESDYHPGMIQTFITVQQGPEAEALDCQSGQSMAMKPHAHEIALPKAGAH